MTVGYVTALISWPIYLLTYLLTIDDVTKSSGHSPVTYICLHRDTSSLRPLSPSAFKNSAGIPSTPSAFLHFNSLIALSISSSNKYGPFSSSSTSSSFSSLNSSMPGLPPLSYNSSIHSRHLLLISSGSFSMTPFLSFILLLLLLAFFSSVKSLMILYNCSVLPRFSNNSNSFTSFVHHSS